MTPTNEADAETGAETGAGPGQTSDRLVLQPDVAIVGAGPAGLTAARELARRLRGDVLVLDREIEAGGIPRHSDHPGYGLRDMRRNMSGPRYAQELVLRAQRAGATVMTGATVTHAAPDRQLAVTTSTGLLAVRPRALVLATGARERPRAARLIPGDRPAGVMTTGELQNEIHLHHREVGTRAVIVGAELVSWSAVLTLRHAGCSTVLMTSTHQHPEIYRPVAALAKAALRVPIATRTEVVAIHGRDVLEGVTLRNLDTREVTEVACDLAVLTGDWIPDHELARMIGLEMVATSKGPAVDMSLRASGDGVFAAGNLVHPVDTAGVAALDGRHVAASVEQWLRNPGPQPQGLHIETAGILRWASPARLAPDDGKAARGRLIGWVDQAVARPTVTVTQGGCVVTARRIRWSASPGRAFRLPTSILDGVDRRGADVVIEVS